MTSLNRNLGFVHSRPGEAKQRRRIVTDAKLSALIKKDLEISDAIAMIPLIVISPCIVDS